MLFVRQFRLLSSAQLWPYAASTCRCWQSHGLSPLPQASARRLLPKRRLVAGSAPRPPRVGGPTATPPVRATHARRGVCRHTRARQYATRPRLRAFALALSCDARGERIAHAPARSECALRGTLRRVRNSSRVTKSIEAFDCRRCRAGWRARASAGAPPAASPPRAARRRCLGDEWRIARGGRARPTHMICWCAASSRVRAGTTHLAASVLSRRSLGDSVGRCPPGCAIRAAPGCERRCVSMPASRPCRSLSFRCFCHSDSPKLLRSACVFLLRRCH